MEMAVHQHDRFCKGTLTTVYETFHLVIEGLIPTGVSQSHDTCMPH